MSQKNAHLVAVSSPASASAQIHIQKNKNGAMLMRPVDALTLTIEFAGQRREEIAVTAVVRPSAKSHTAMQGMPDM